MLNRLQSIAMYTSSDHNNALDPGVFKVFLANACTGTCEKKRENIREGQTDVRGDHSRHKQV